VSEARPLEDLELRPDLVRPLVADDDPSPRAAAIEGDPFGLRADCVAAELGEEVPLRGEDEDTAGAERLVLDLPEGVVGHKHAPVELVRRERLLVKETGRKPVHERHAREVVHVHLAFPHVRHVDEPPPPVIENRDPLGVREPLAEAADVDEVGDTMDHDRAGAAVGGDEEIARHVAVDRALEPGDRPVQRACGDPEGLDPRRRLGGHEEEGRLRVAGRVPEADVVVVPAARRQFQLDGHQRLGGRAGPCRRKPRQEQRARAGEPDPPRGAGRATPGVGTFACREPGRMSFTGGAHRGM
jgi:hypothetical protein